MTVDITPVTGHCTGGGAQTPRAPFPGSQLAGSVRDPVSASKGEQHGETPAHVHHHRHGTQIVLFAIFHDPLSAYKFKSIFRSSKRSCVLCIVVGRFFLNEESEGKVLTHYCCDISRQDAVIFGTCPLKAYSPLWSSQLLKAPSPVYRDLSGKRFATCIRNHKPREMEELFVRAAVLEMYNLERGGVFTARETGT